MDVAFDAIQTFSPQWVLVVKQAPRGGGGGAL